MAAPVILAPLIAALLRGFSLLVGAKLGLWVMKVLGLLGLAFATNTFLVDPILDQVQARFADLPGELVPWMRAIGATESLSIMVSAFTLVAGQRVFLKKK